MSLLHAALRHMCVLRITGAGGARIVIIWYFILERMHAWHALRGSAKVLPKKVTHCMSACASRCSVRSLIEIADASAIWLPACCVAILVEFSRVDRYLMRAALSTTRHRREMYIMMGHGQKVASFNIPLDNREFLPAYSIEWTKLLCYWCTYGKCVYVCV